MPDDSPLVTLPSATDGRDVHKVHPQHVRRISDYPGRDESTFPVAMNRTMTTPARDSGSVVVVKESVLSDGLKGIGGDYTKIYTTLTPDEVESLLYS